MIFSTVIVSQAVQCRPEILKIPARIVCSIGFDRTNSQKERSPFGFHQYPASQQRTTRYPYHSLSRSDPKFQTPRPDYPTSLFEYAIHLKCLYHQLLSSFRQKHDPTTESWDTRSLPPIVSSTSRGIIDSFGTPIPRPNASRTEAQSDRRTDSKRSWDTRCLDSSELG